jgi:hypothetical protein
LPAWSNHRCSLAKNELLVLGVVLVLDCQTLGFRKRGRVQRFKKYAGRPVSGEAWSAVSERHGNAARELAMLIARGHSPMTLREIGQKLGGMSYAAVSDAARFEKS